jgi:hypothetical protein
MDLEFFESRQMRIFDAERSHDFQKSVMLCRLLRNELLDEEPSDSVQLGWVRFREFESLVAAESLENAYTLFHSEEPHAWVIPASDYAKMVAKMPRIAAHMKLAEEVVGFTVELLDSVSKGDLLNQNTAMILEETCGFLEGLGRSDLTPDFACPLLEIARLHGNGDVVIKAMESICLSLQKNRNLELVAVLLNHLGYVISLKGSGQKEAATKLYHRIQNLILRLT